MVFVQQEKSTQLRSFLNVLMRFFECKWDVLSNLCANFQPIENLKEIFQSRKRNNQFWVVWKSFFFTKKQKNVLIEFFKLVKINWKLFVFWNRKICRRKNRISKVHVSKILSNDIFSIRYASYFYVLIRFTSWFNKIQYEKKNAKQNTNCQTNEKKNFLAML